MARRPIKKWSKRKRIMRRRATNKWTRRKKGTASTRKAAVTYSSGLHFLSPKYLGKLPYADTKTIAAGVSGAATTYRYRLTSIQDPDYTGIGHQPRYHDQLEIFYGQYRVVGAKMTCKFSLVDPSHKMTCGLRTSVGPANDPTSHIEMLERPDVKHLVLDSTRTHGSLTCFYSAKKTYGKGSLASLTASFGSSPTEEFYGNFHTINTIPGTAAHDVNVQVHITFIVLCTERKQISAS